MQYWPPALDKLEVYGDIHLGIVKEEQLANFQIRTFRIWKLNDDVSISDVIIYNQHRQFKTTTKKQTHTHLFQIHNTTCNPFSRINYRTFLHPSDL